MEKKDLNFVQSFVLFCKILLFPKFNVYLEDPTNRTTCKNFEALYDKVDCYDILISEIYILFYALGRKSARKIQYTKQ